MILLSPSMLVPDYYLKKSHEFCSLPSNLHYLHNW